MKRKPGRPKGSKNRKDTAKIVRNRISDADFRRIYDSGYVDGWVKCVSERERKAAQAYISNMWGGFDNAR